MGKTNETQVKKTKTTAKSVKIIKKSTATVAHKPSKNVFFVVIPSDEKKLKHAFEAREAHQKQKEHVVNPTLKFILVSNNKKSQGSNLHTGDIQVFQRDPTLKDADGNELVPIFLGERKLRRDMGSSIKNGHLHNQVKRMKELQNLNVKTCIIHESPDNSVDDTERRQNNGFIVSRAFNDEIPTFVSQDTDETVEVIVQSINKIVNPSDSSKATFAKNGQGRKCGDIVQDNVLLHMLMATCPSISSVTAELITKKWSTLEILCEVLGKNRWLIAKHLDQLHYDKLKDGPTKRALKGTPKELKSNTAIRDSLYEWYTGRKI
jgi:ERCC4-type nuclease